MEHHILIEHQGSQILISLNKPDKMNAIGVEMIQELIDLLNKVEADETVKSVIITGVGDKSFSAGGNLKEFESLDKQGVAAWIQSGYKAFNLLENLSKPTIAAISGYCLGGGLELALACDFRIAAENAVFGSPELKHGWIPGWGGMTRLKRLIGESKAKEVILLSQNFNARMAYEMGLLFKVTKAQKYMEESKKLADQLSNIDPFVYTMAKKAIMDSQHSRDEHNQMYDVLSTLYSKFIR